uniref:Uncharacterized protein n=1 Tax=Timspurckia oligopyrenoides TaxID=708627 RepID=A0A7S1ESN8_9RHOD|mmetsp:Transcript_4975/g.8637  ORF Transcript_4975/g.8637 Transcript_4975/m.8637 type:complete len:117 (+) Transcript_4975:135-485(+)
MSNVQYTNNEKFDLSPTSKRLQTNSDKLTRKQSMARFTSMVKVKRDTSAKSSDNSKAIVTSYNDSDDDDGDVFVNVVSRVSLAVDEYVDFVVAPKKSSYGKLSGKGALRKLLAKFN